MFNNFVNHTLSTEYHLFNKTGCKFTVTNVYFKKENDIILKGALWKEAESQSLCHAHHLRSPKTLRPASRAPQGVAPRRPRPPPGPRGAPSGLFIVESVFICFIMKNKFEKYIDMHFYTGT